MGIVELSFVGLLAIMGYLGILYFVLFLRFRARLEYLWFALLNFDWMGHCFYVWERFHVYTPLAVNHAFTWRVNFQFAGQLFLLLFVKEFLGLKFQGMLRWILASLAVLFAIHVHSPVALHYSEVTGIDRDVLFTGEVFYNTAGKLSWIYPFFVANVIACFGWCTYHGLKARSYGNRRRGFAILMSMLTVIPIVFYSVASDLSFVSNLPLLSHAIVGLIISMSLMMTDEITQLAHLKIQLAESQRRIAQIADTVPGALFQLFSDSSNNTAFCFVNHGMHSILGLQIHDGDLWEKFTQHLQPDDSRRLQELFADHVLGSDSICEFSGQYLHPQKGPLWIRIECAKTEDSDGLRLTGIILDQSATHQLELEREVTMRELKLRNEEQESVLYATSHDLKTPLVNIRGFAGELEEMLRAIRNARPDFDKDDEVLEKFKESAQAIGFIQRNMARMESLIQNLLHVMRAGRVPLVMETVNLNQIIQSVLQVLHHQVQKAEAKIHVADLPLCTADVMQMEMIFTNLLDNALKFRKPDQPMLIEVGASVEGAKVILFVRDNGRGFESRYANKVFELFHRLTPNTNEVGDGIGLTLVRRAMLRLGGSIRAESELGVGTTFWLELQR